MLAGRESRCNPIIIDLIYIVLIDLIMLVVDMGRFRGFIFGPFNVFHILNVKRKMLSSVSEIPVKDINYNIIILKLMY
jgi:hypothetical protein